MKTDNELIAEFMGIPVNHQYGLEVQLPLDNPSKNGYWTRPMYEESWDWLMPVVEKIETLGYFCMINKWTSVYTGSDGERIQVTTVEGKSKIQNTYKAVVEFIKWYNQQKS